MSAAGRPIDRDERAAKSASDLMHYGWSMLIRRDWGGSNPKSQILSLFNSDLKSRIRSNTHSQSDLQKLSEQLLYASNSRMNRVLTGVKDRLSHTKTEIIERLNALDKLKSEELHSAHEIFKDWDSVFVLHDIQVVHTTNCINTMLNKKTDLIDGVVEQVLSYEDTQRRKLKTKLEGIKSTIMPKLRELERSQIASVI